MTLNRILAHLKTFASWVHRQQPFPLGSPLANLAALSTPTVLALERALTLAEQRQLLDAADLLVEIGGRSRDRRAHGSSGERPRRKGYRPYRNRAIIYTLLGTGMRRAAIRNLNLAAVDFDRRLVTVTEKDGAQQTYHISRAALAAIRDYLTHERPGNAAGTASPALFLAAPRRTVQIPADRGEQVGIDPRKAPLPPLLEPVDRQPKPARQRLERLALHQPQHHRACA